MQEAALHCASANVFWHWGHWEKGLLSQGKLTNSSKQPFRSLLKSRGMAMVNVHSPKADPLSKPQPALAALHKWRMLSRRNWDHDAILDCCPDELIRCSLFEVPTHGRYPTLMVSPLPLSLQTFSIGCTLRFLAADDPLHDDHLDPNLFLPIIPYPRLLPWPLSAFTSSLQAGGSEVSGSLFIRVFDLCRCWEPTRKQALRVHAWAQELLLLGGFPACLTKLSVQCHNLPECHPLDIIPTQELLCMNCFVGCVLTASHALAHASKASHALAHASKASHVSEHALKGSQAS
eukprot:scaffold79955_cov14-Tisochrysis_lutea.AAC.1